MPQSRISHCSSTMIIITWFISVYISGILAQSTTATCLSSFGWMKNSRGQSPCLLAAYLQSACTDGRFTVDPLPLGYSYTGPYTDEQNPCQCSSVTYNAISACGLCQNRKIISWSGWNINCSTVYPGVYTPDIPSGTAVPQWAFQDVTITDVFNVTLALSVGDGPESIATRPRSTVSASVYSTPGLSSSKPYGPSDPSTSSILPSSTASGYRLSRLVQPDGAYLG